MSERDPIYPDTDAFGQGRLFARKFGFKTPDQANWDAVGRAAGAVLPEILAGSGQLFVSPIDQHHWNDMGMVRSIRIGSPVVLLHARPSADQQRYLDSINQYLNGALGAVSGTPQYSGLLDRADEWPMVPLRQQLRDPWHDWFDRVTRPAVTVRWKTWYAGIRWRYEAWSRLYINERSIRYADTAWAQTDRFADPTEYDRALWRKVFAPIPPLTVEDEILSGDRFTDVMGRPEVGSLSMEDLDRWMQRVFDSAEGAAERLAREEAWLAEERNRKLDRWYPGWRRLFDLAQEVERADDAQPGIGRAAQESGSDALQGPVAVSVRDQEAVRPQMGRDSGGGAGAEDGLPQPAPEEGSA